MNITQSNTKIDTEIDTILYNKKMYKELITIYELPYYKNIWKEYNKLKLNDDLIHIKYEDIISNISNDMKSIYRQIKRIINYEKYINRRNRTVGINVLVIGDEKKDIDEIYYPFYNEINELENIIKEINKKYRTYILKLDIPIKFKENELINGYKVYNCHNSSLWSSLSFSLDVYKIQKQKFDNKTIIPFEDFASKLCNCISNSIKEEVYNLPYSHEYILDKSYDICDCDEYDLSPFRGKSVSQINTECEIFNRRIKIMENNSLEMLCILTMIENNMPLDDIPECIKEKYDYFI